MATPIDHVNALYRPFLNQGRPGKFHFTRFMHGYIEFNPSSASTTCAEGSIRRKGVIMHKRGKWQPVRRI